jgi:hypothetical protein
MSPFLITRWWAQTAHSYGMAIGLKNAGNLLSEFNEDAGKYQAGKYQSELVANFDFNVIEACVSYTLPGISKILLTQTDSIQRVSDLRLHVGSAEASDPSRVQEQDQEVSRQGQGCHFLRLLWRGLEH